MRALDPAVFPVDLANNWPCFGRVRISLSSEGHLNSTSNVNAHRRSHAFKRGILRINCAVAATAPPVFGPSAVDRPRTGFAVFR
jgi:hypothetical protein